MNDTSRSYILDVSDEVPDFRLDSQLGAIRFRDLIDGKWCLLVSIHKAFDPVATTEIGALQKLLDEFTARNIAVVVISNDSVSNYRKWIKDINELELTQIEIPLVSDPGAVTLKQYGVVREIPPYGELKVTSVGTFLIDMDKRIRSSMKYSINAGRNFYESLRLFDALQLTTNYSVMCPANWGHGQDVFVNNVVTTKEATNLFPKGFVEIKPWFRLTPYPEDA